MGIVHALGWLLSSTHTSIEHALILQLGIGVAGSCKYTHCAMKHEGVYQGKQVYILGGGGGGGMTWPRDANLHIYANYPVM